jgi:hypothetical protein
MPGGFAPRFLVEAGFLILLGVGAGYADLRPIVIVAIVAGGWLVVALIEASIWQAQARTVATYIPPPPTVVEEIVEEPEPAEEEVAVEDTDYPLRADAGEEPSEEVEAYTRILSRPAEDEPAAEDAQ